MQVRSTVRIAIVDDEKFLARPNLASYGYDISELPDLRSISEVQSFDIVLCDLMGVGANFDKNLGGASIIKELKTNYPNKYVIAYTGARANSTEASSAKEFADEFLKKDAEISKWVEKLDDAIEYVSDPYERWLTARQGLIDAEVDIRRIVEFESAYVKSIKSKDGKFTELKRLLEQIDLGHSAKAIIQGLISSAIYGLIFSS
jgi:DNA-binding NtrC family response regulator